VHIKKSNFTDLAVDIKLFLLLKHQDLQGAELATLCNEAQLLAARRNKRAWKCIDFQDLLF